jgi:hypothetical protein
MMPMLPQTHLETLDSEHLHSHARLRVARHIDPDRFLGDDYAPPDRIFMALRLLATTGPIGALKDRLNRWRNARGDGEHSAESSPVEPGRLPDPRAGSIPDNDAEPPIAA